MTRRRIIIIAIGCALLTAILFLWRNQEPFYNGRSLSRWVIAYHDDESNEVAAHAIRHIGARAIPHLLQWVDYEKTDAKQNWLDRINQPIAWIQDKLGATGVWTIQDGAENRSEAAEVVFALLAEHANHAVPQLTSFLNDVSHPYRADTAAGCLARLGQAGLPPLQAAMEGTNNQLRATALRKAFLIETNTARLIVPLLIKALGDTNTGCVVAATQSLRRLNLQPDTAVPALAMNLQTADESVVLETVFALEFFGPPARSAIPAITNLLTHPELGVRWAATNALHAIDPQQFTNSNDGRDIGVLHFTHGLAVTGLTNQLPIVPTGTNPIGTFPTPGR